MRALSLDVVSLWGVEAPAGLRVPYGPVRVYRVAAIPLHEPAEEVFRG